MNIVYHLTDNYARISGTSIISAFENNKDIEEINVYLIGNGLTDDTKHKFTDLAKKYNRKIFFIPLPDLNGKEYNLGLVCIKKRWMFDSYSRLFLDQLLPEEIDRVIYLDGDILILDSLKDLWELDLKGKCCAACMDCVSKPYYQLFGIDERNRYCNSGVILIDLKAWRNKYISEKVKRYVRKNNGYTFFMEQTVFNVILQDEIIYLSLKYNVSSLVQVLSYKDLIKLRKPLHFYSEKEVKQAMNHPTIVHMTGFFYVINRAWNEVTNHPERKRFIEYCSLLGWNGEVLQKDQRDFQIRLKDAVVHSLPKPIMIRITSFLYNTWRIQNIKRISKKIEKEKVSV